MKIYCPAASTDSEGFLFQSPWGEPKSMILLLTGWDETLIGFKSEWHITSFEELAKPLALPFRLLVFSYSLLGKTHSSAVYNTDN
ncbi:hypothetical protein SCARR_02751 [Pontiella sulfatireligans]|uniref:Uncharacterized protein n=1 Tax=Pontiella sulfatireligans TaxID=2750658 RepID=A0A6C2UKC3_9BACT|nr:hypothetical protein SCARR_02751 [Pontiella sulfatireligans]